MIEFLIVLSLIAVPVGATIMSGLLWFAVSQFGGRALDKAWAVSFSAVTAMTYVFVWWAWPGLD